MANKTLHYLTKPKRMQGLIDRKSSSDSIFEPIKKIERQIPEKAFKILDSPGYKDDYYSQLLDWNIQDQIILSVNNEIFIHKFDTKKTFKLHTQSVVVNSLKSNHNNKVIFGANQGFVMLYDQISENCYKYQEFHDGRITTIDFFNESVILTGSIDKKVCLYDLRNGKVEKTFQTHKNIISKISVNKQDNMKIISGGCDKKIVLYDLRSDKIQEKKKAHNSAIRALDWDYNNRFNFYSGGGTNDNTLKKWNSIGFQIKQKKQFNTQICDLVYNSKYKEVILGFGFNSNQIGILKSNDFQQIANLKGHQRRVLDIKLSHDQQKLVSASSDGSVRFWQLDINQNKKIQHQKTRIDFQDEFIRQLNLLRLLYNFMIYNLIKI